MSKKKKRQNRSAENPNVPIDVAVFNDAAADALGAPRSASGVRVGHRRAFGYPAYWRAVNLIAGDVGKIPLITYRMQGANREHDRSHPAYRLLATKPNRNTTAYIFKQTLQAHTLTTGNGYAYIDRDRAGRPLELLILDPRNVSATKYNGELWYLYQPSNSKPRKLPAVDVLHWKGLGFDGVVGYPVLEYMADSLGLAVGARDYSARYFRNNTNPGGVLEHPGKLTDIGRRNMRESWERLHRGLDNVHKVAILEEGVKYNAFQSNARDAQLLESRQFDAREIANIFGVPSHKLGDSSKVAYNSLGEENQSYWNDTLSSWFTMISQENHDKLLSEKEKAAGTHCIDFDYSAIQRANPEAQMTYATKGFAGGIMTQNEARATIGLNATADDSGEEFVELGAKSSESEPEDDAETVAETEPETPETERKQPKNAHFRGISPGLRLLIDDIGGRMVRRLATHAERAAKSGKLDEWAKSVENEHISTVSSAFSPLVVVANERGTGSTIDAATLARFVIAQTVESIGRDAKPDAIQWATDRLLVPNICAIIATELGEPNEQD
jgi:HK97 family phage portal protein